jgi:DNA polymerase-3 subunit beta
MSQQLGSAQRVLNSKNAMPILDCFLLEVVGDNFLDITASDAENTLRLTCPLVGFTPDEDANQRRFCVKARMMIDALKEVPSQPVTLTVNMQTMEIKGEYANGSFNFVGEGAAEYPEPPALPSDCTKLAFADSSQLFADIDSVAFALSDDEVRPVMTGIFFDLTPEQMTVVGTNGKVLVRRTTAAHDGLELPSSQASFIMSKKTSAILRALLPKTDSPVTISFSATNVVVETAEYQLTSRLIDGRYPNYNSVIPKNSPFTANVSVADVVPALRRDLEFANEAVLVRLELAANGLELATQDVDYSRSSRETVAAEWNGPAGFSIGVNGSLFLEALRHLQKDIEILLSDPTRALILQPAEQGETEALILVMPMQLID